MDEVTFAVTTVVVALLTEATQEAYQRARGAFGRLSRRGGEGAADQLERLDRDRAVLEAASGAEREEALQTAVAAWTPVVERLAEADPRAYAELVAQTRLDHRVSVVNQHNHGAGTFINGNVEGGLTITHGAARGREA
ncbi:hypothetical protein [Streptomyces sp. H34-S4]|uniref:hypothetical protein n=1 Tax=Streptomyces sp. H34-S4 TaxID=2996463 RepID=UPI00226DDAB8|nr:hypothetical protein [Streptomyces sp. H34-S4]MCY0937881.1 hypothetical protein [Streptomyces sp. H34-S4]